MDGFHELGIVTMLALLEYMILGVMVGQARGKYGVEAPATTGNPDFERIFRVHVNTLEHLIVFIPAVWIFSVTINYHLGVILGRCSWPRASFTPRLYECRRQARPRRDRQRRNQWHPGPVQPDLADCEGTVSKVRASSIYSSTPTPR